MKPTDMQRGKTYIVTKGNKNKTVRKDDIVFIGDLPILEQKNVLMIQSRNMQGYLEEREWKSKGYADFEVKEKQLFCRKGFFTPEFFEREV